MPGTVLAAASKVVQLPNRLSVTPWTAAHQASLPFINSRGLLKLMSIESVMPSNHLILSCSLLLRPSIFPSMRVFFNESALCIRWPKYGSFSISPSNEYSGLISFRIDWLDLLAVQGTVKSLPQHHNSNPLSSSHLPRQHLHVQLWPRSLLNLKLAFACKLKTFCKTKSMKMKGGVKLHKVSCTQASCIHILPT